MSAFFTTLKDNTRYAWWLLWIIVPLTIWKFNFLSGSILKQLGVYTKCMELNPVTQIKVRLKVLHVVYFGSTFFIASTGLGILFGTNDPKQIIADDHYTYFVDKILKLGLVLVGTMDICEMVFYTKQLKWYSWLHHTMELFVFIAIYDYKIPFIIGRVYCGIFGVLLTARWPLHVASAFYYVGDKENMKLRISLYCTGLIIHTIFALSQLLVGIIFEVIGFYLHQINIPRLIFFTVFQICVLPSQLISVHDIHQIIQVKIRYDQRVRMEQQLQHQQIEVSLEEKEQFLP